MSRFAIVIGSNGPPLNRLKFAEIDARQMARALAHPLCGYEVTTIFAPKRRGAVIDALSEIAGSCREEDQIVIYFSGHGLVSNGKLFLLFEPQGTDDLQLGSLGAHHVTELLNTCRAKGKIFILDCCNAGSLVAGLGFKTERVPIEEVGLNYEGHYVLMASGHLESAREFEMYAGSFLTWALGEALEPKFSDADRDRDGALLLNECAEYLQRKAKEHNKGNSDQRVPMPRLFGVGTQLFLTQRPDQWLPYTELWPDDTEMVLLPILRDEKHAFCIGRFPITNRQYRRFVKSRRHRKPVGQALNKGDWDTTITPWDDMRLNDDDLPVVCVSYDDAVAYRKWIAKEAPLQAGVGADHFGLPIADVWDYAAFGDRYPSWNPANFKNLAGFHHMADRPATRVTGASRRNVFGVDDMLGNVWEWCGPSDENDLKWSYLPLRGGSFPMNIEEGSPYTNAAAFGGLESRYFDVGFRIAGLMRLDRLPPDICKRASRCPVITVTVPRRRAHGQTRLNARESFGVSK